MPDFKFEVDGVSIPVRGAANRSEAADALQEAIRQNPGFVELQRERFLDTAGSATNRFLVGAGRTLTGAGRFVQETANRIGGDVAEAERIARLDKAEQEAFQRLDDKTEFIGAEDFGQSAPEIATGVGAGVAAAASLARLGIKKLSGPMKSIMNTRLARGAGGADEKASVFEELFDRGDLSPREIVDLAASPFGKQVMRQMDAVRSPEARKAFLDTLVDSKRAAEAGAEAAEAGTPEAIQAAARASDKVRESARRFDDAQLDAGAQAARSPAQGLARQQAAQSGTAPAARGRAVDRQQNELQEAFRGVGQ